MALDFIEKKIYLIEVNSSADYQKAIRFTNRLEKDNCTNIESYIRKNILNNELPSFNIVWSLFVRSRHIDRMKKEPSYISYLAAAK